MTEKEKKFVTSSIKNEGFDYCFESWSDFKKEVKDDIFHILREEYLRAKKNLENYIK